MKFIVIALLPFLVFGCYTKNVSDFQPIITIPDSVVITYTNNVKPIITTNCSFSSSCHSSASIVFGLDDYTSTKSNGDLIVKAINHTAGTSPMPKGGSKLSSSDIATIEKWVQTNYPN